jgi:hypothetical protein
MLAAHAQYHHSGDTGDTGDTEVLAGWRCAFQLECEPLRHKFRDISVPLSLRMIISGMDNFLTYRVTLFSRAPDISELRNF